MKFVFNDGGRKAAGFKGRCGDCVVRAIAIVTGLPYKQVHDDLAKGNGSQRKSKRVQNPKKSVRNGVYTRRKWFKDYMTALGFKWTPTMGIGTGCRVHLAEEELPKGKIIVAVSKHYTAVIDGEIHDTYNPNDRGVTIFPPQYPKEQLPKNVRWLPNGNGWAYDPKRCVYGYWSK